MSKATCLRCGKPYQYHFMDVGKVEDVNIYCGRCRLLMSIKNKMECVCKKCGKKCDSVDFLGFCDNCVPDMYDMM